MDNLALLTAQPTEDRQVVLIIPSVGDSMWLAKFIREVPEVFAGRILKTIGSLKETLVTLELQTSIRAEDAVSKLTRMPAVEKVEEKPPSKDKTADCQRFLVNLRKSSPKNDQELSPNMASTE